MKRSLIKAIKLLALKSVIDPDESYFLRRVFRFYSTTYHTPLHVVPDLPLEDVLLTYFENKYEELKEEDDESLWLKEMILLTETDQERKERELEEEVKIVSDEEFLKQIMAEEAKKKQMKIEDHKPAEKAPIKTRRDLREVQIPQAEPKKEFEMTFVSEEEMDELTEKDALAGAWDVLGNSKKK